MSSLRRAIGAGVTVVISTLACRDSTAIEALPVAASMTATSIATQSAIVMRFVASRPTVSVSDHLGRPIGGVQVLFSVSGGSSSTAITANDGTASQAWQLGPRAGTQTMVVAVPRSSVPAVTFIAKALPDTAVALDAGSAQLQAAFASASVPLPPTVVVVDAFGNGEAGIEVRFDVGDGAGTVSPATTTTDVNGRATAAQWILGPGSRDNTLTARASGFAPVTFTARVNTPLLGAAVATGARHSCAIALNGTAYCWGSNAAAQINGSIYSSFAVPTRISSPHNFVSLATGESHTCAISDENPPQAYCWGGSSFAVPPAGGVPVEAPMRDGATFVTAGGAHDCALAPSGEAYCWGVGTWGQLGDGGTSDHGVPARVATDLRFVSLAAGAQHTCGLTATGHLYCWGLDDHGQLGFESGANCFTFDYYYPAVPVQCALGPLGVPNVPPFVAIAAGFGTCGLTSQGEVYCAGFRPGGMVSVSRDIRFDRLAPDGNCGLTADGAAYCWATIVGTASASLSDGPMRVGDRLTFRSITSSNGHQCGIVAQNASVVCWGRNDVGQLGNGTTTFGIVALPVRSPSTP